MDVTTTKILIIFGLLILTLFAALLPLFCVQYSSLKRRRQRRSSEGFWAKLFWCCNTGSGSKNGDSPIPDDTGSKMSKSSSSSLTKRKSRSQRLMSALNCFAGGIFLGTSFIGLLPEIRDTFETFEIKWPQLSGPKVMLVNGTKVAEESEAALMPIAEIVITCGLFLILIVEQTAHGVNHWYHKNKSKKQKRGDKKTLQVEAGEITAMEMTQPDGNSQTNNSDTDDEVKQAHEHASIRSLMLVASLSVHSLLEGIAMGLQKDLGSVMSIFIAVLFHKMLMAFSMGTNLVQSKQAIKKVLVAALIFSMMSPVGILTSLIIEVAGGNGYVTTLINVVLQAIATGTFLYITFFEVLVAEFEGHGQRITKVVSLLLGYGAILGSIFAQHG
uniref:Zinc transporter ZIP1 n=1 Tax=Phallusia mammillata TaxID=59560 RepID=A0A6F9DTC9_9ASCI|nr:zinc transporter ZIP1 [Phallusia mammillata]